jgi:hypothetical protein
MISLVFKKIVISCLEEPLGADASNKGRKPIKKRCGTAAISVYDTVFIYIHKNVHEAFAKIFKQ